MKKTFLLVAFVILVFSCNKNDDDNINDNNPFLLPPIVNIDLNLNLPQYNPLRFDGNTVVLNSEGIRGIVVYRQSNTQFFAYDLADPNHVPTSCSRMDLDGLIATCPCTSDENSYVLSLFGLHQGDQDNNQPMLPYRVQKNGDVVSVRN